MNYLGHFFLSGYQPEVVFGNYIGDAVKGSGWKSYPADVQTGIKLHRFIDSFTDQHPQVSQAKKRISPYFSITSSVVIDMYFDHFLSKNWSDYHPEPLSVFVERISQILKPFKSQMPGKYPLLIQRIEQQSWMESYQTVEGITFALKRMGERVSFDNQWDRAGEVLLKNYDLLASDFELFFPALILMINKKFKIYPGV